MERARRHRSAKAAGGLTVTRMDMGHWGVVYQAMLVTRYTNTETGQVFTTPDISTTGGGGTWKAEYFMTVPAGTRSPVWPGEG